MSDMYQLQYIHNHHTTTIREKDSVIYVTFPKLYAYQKDMLHGFSTRHGGVSKEHLYAMNLSFSRGDEEENVRVNHKRFAKTIGYDEKRLVFSDQVHQTKIHKVTEDDIGKGITKQSDIKNIDGLVTNIPGIPLITFYADCVPLFFFDPVLKVIAMAHSGWKGTVGKIGAKMIDYMQSEYGSRAEDIVCAIGPSICQACYEVSEDVAEQFLDVFGTGFGNDLLYKKENGKYQLNLHKACEMTLLESGVKAEHMDITDLCTCCNPDFFYSHRASAGMRGNLAGVMMLL